MSDQDRISPYNIKQTSDENKEINQIFISWSNTKFSKPTSQEPYGRQLGELLIRSWELKVNVIAITEGRFLTRFCDASQKLYHVFMW